MKHHSVFRRMIPLLLAAALLAAAYFPAGAFFFNFGQEEDQEPTVIDFSKNGPVDQPIVFSPDDFQIAGASSKVTLEGIRITSLPDQQAGALQMGNELVVSGADVSISALGGLKFYPATNTAEGTTATFTFQPIFSTGAGSSETTVTLHLLAQANEAPTAENLTLSTYKNVAVNGQFRGVDPEGDLLTFQLVSKPARGAVTISEDGTGAFVYTPYENKTGKDTFTYVAVDALGNTSPEATVSLKIEKAGTKVTYADMSGNGAHRAAVKLAEEGVFVGASINGSYYFAPDTPVSRSEFLAMAMEAMGVSALEGVTATGFADDDSIAAWAKPYVASALQAGYIQGSADEQGQIVFSPNNTITAGEASVLLDRLIQVTEASVETFGAQYAAAPAWAVQAAVNLSSSGVLASSVSLEDSLTRADAAELLCGAIELVESREDHSLFPW